MAVSFLIPSGSAAAKEHAAEPAAFGRAVVDDMLSQSRRVMMRKLRLGSDGRMTVFSKLHERNGRYLICRGFRKRGPTDSAAHFAGRTARGSHVHPASWSSPTLAVESWTCRDGRNRCRLLFAVVAVAGVDRPGRLPLREVLVTGYTADLVFLERHCVALARGLGARVTVLTDAGQGVHDPVDVRHAGRLPARTRPLHWSVPPQTRGAHR